MTNMSDEQLDALVDTIDKFYEKLVERAEFFPDTAAKITIVATPSLINNVMINFSISNGE